MCVCVWVSCDVALPGSYVSISGVMLSVLGAPRERHSHDSFLYCLAKARAHKMRTCMHTVERVQDRAEEYRWMDAMH